MNFPAGALHTAPLTSFSNTRFSNLSMVLQWGDPFWRSRGNSHWEVWLGQKAVGETVSRDHSPRIWKTARKVLGLLARRKRPSPEGSTSKADRWLGSDGCCDSVRLCVGRVHHSLQEQCWGTLSTMSVPQPLPSASKQSLRKIFLSTNILFGFGNSSV